MVIPVLLYGCETLTLNTDLKRRINIFGTRCLRKIMGYHWYYFLSNQQLFRETNTRPTTNIIRQCQEQLYERVARYTVAIPAYRVVFEYDNTA